jgi:hypothetical protein
LYSIFDDLDIETPSEEQNKDEGNNSLVEATKKPIVKVRAKLQTKVKLIKIK